MVDIFLSRNCLRLILSFMNNLVVDFDKAHIRGTTQ
jgi:hypothetical protein